MTVAELIERLQKFSSDLEVWGFNYGDNEAFEMSEIAVWRPGEKDSLGIDKSVYGVEKEVLMLK